MILALLLAAGAAGQPQEALLLGVRGSNGALTTVLADADGFHELGAGLAVPRADGFWVVTAPRRKDGEYDDQLLLARKGAPSAIPTPEPGSACEGSNSITVLFVSPDAISRQEKGGSSCEGAAHPSDWDVVRTDDVASLQPGKRLRSLSIGTALGRAAVSALARDGAIAKKKLEAQEQECLEEPDEDNWALVRSRGRWIARASLPEAGRACAAFVGELFTVDTNIPDKFTGAFPLPKPWETIVREHPGTIDAVASPSGTLLVLVSKSGLTLERSGKKTGAIAANGAALVMSQAATGAAAVRWKTDAAAALAAH